MTAPLTSARRLPRVDLALPGVNPPLPLASQQQAAAERARPSGRSHGVVTGARIILWLGAHSRPKSAQAVARALALDLKHVRDSLKVLASLGLIQSFEVPLPGVRVTTVYALIGGFDVVPTVHDPAGG